MLRAVGDRGWVQKAKWTDQIYGRGDGTAGGEWGAVATLEFSQGRPSVFEVGVRAVGA